MPICCLGSFGNGSEKTNWTLFKFREKDRNRSSFGSFPFPCQCPHPCPLHKSVLLFSFGLFRNADFLFWFVSKHRKKQFFIYFSFAKKTEIEPKLIEFRFEPKQKNCLFRGHPIWAVIFRICGATTAPSKIAGRQEDKSRSTPSYSM